jgi:hypothetical protein
MEKPKKRSGMASPVIPQGHHAVQDALDNPPDASQEPSQVMDANSGRDLPKARTTRQNSRLWPTESMTLDNEPVSNPIDHTLLWEAPK